MYIIKFLFKVIKRIYELAWEQFSDLPRGHHKNNSMHKLASKTMIEILPDRLSKHIEAKCGSLATTPDFFDVIGQVSWFESESTAAASAHVTTPKAEPEPEPTPAPEPETAPEVAAAAE
jgi:hypothetical protein